MSVVWKIEVVKYPNNKTEVSGVLLKGSPVLIDTGSTVFRNLRSIISTYFSPTLSNASIQVTVNRSTETVKTDSKGKFKASFICDSPKNIFIQPNGMETISPILQDYPLVFSNTNSSFDIISDIDDTIVKSYTSDIAKRISTILFKRAGNRKTVEYTWNLFQSLKKFNPGIYYVSKSESNLFYLLASIIESADLPKGTLFLTPYLKWYQVFKPKKGLNYKYNNIAAIISKSEPKKFILLGDDTQRDMDVYTQVVKDFPGRIVHVYIRQTRLKRNFIQLKKWHNLQSTEVSATYFTEDDVFSEFPDININQNL